VITIAGSHEIEIASELFNVLGFLDRDWGRKYFVSNGVNYGQVALLQLVGYDEAHARGRYVFLPPRQREFDVEGTRWQMRLSAKYRF
jgi:hypothetical protein